MSRNQELSIASIVLAGGQGTRLLPLTLNHSKPAVSFGGRYRLIDIPISNSLNSNIRQIFVIGQYLTTELQQHLTQTYQFDQFFPGMIDFLGPEENNQREKIWFEGTADAIRKNLSKIYMSMADYFLILSGDQLYNINFAKMFEFAVSKDADLTIASLPVGEENAKRLGILKTNSRSQIINFYEKPQEASILEEYRQDHKHLKKCGFHKEEPSYLGSMGIYIFKREALRRLLEEDNRADFGKHLIPSEIERGKTFAFIYDGYWEDIGTIKSYYEANLALTRNPALGLKTYDESNPIYTRVNHLPGTKLKNTKIRDSVICEGCIIDAESIENSVIGLRSYIKTGTVIRNSIIMGNNFYLPPMHHVGKLPQHFEIGHNCQIEKAIIDEHVCIGDNVRLINEKGLKHYDSDKVFVRDGIIIITAGTFLPENFVF